MGDYWQERLVIKRCTGKKLSKFKTKSTGSYFPVSGKKRYLFEKCYDSRCMMKKIFLFIAAILCTALASHIGFVYGDDTMN